MKKLMIGLIVAAATAVIMVPLALAGGGNSDNAKTCQQGGWQNLVRQDGTGFNNTGDCVAYAAQGGVLKPKPAPGPIAVSVPAFGLNTTTCSVTVPYVNGIDTFLYGVNGHPETEAITHDVTVTGSLSGAPDTAPQFWIGYKAQPGHEITNLASAPWHFDFYNGDDVLDCGAA
jgi:hypothetical protein